MGELLPIAALLSEVFKIPRFADVAYLDWLYRQNPDGHEIATDFSENGQCLGHYVVVPVQWQSLAGPERMALSLNTAVSSRARLKGLFVRLATDTYAKAADQGVHAIVGVANANSTPGFCRRLDFRLIQQIPVVVGVSSLRRHDCQTVDPATLPRTVLAGLLSKLDYSPPEWRGCSPSWAEGSPPLPWGVAWTPDKLAWRLQSPASRYRLHLSPDGAMVSTLGRVGPVRVAIIVKTMTGAPLPAVRGLLSAACRTHRTPFLLYAGVNNRMRVEGVQLPKRMMPVPLNFIYRPLTAAAPAAEAFTLGHFEFLDFDAY